MISAGTRNHFALDLGLDRDDPATGLDALTDGDELRMDLGMIGDRTFVNNASFGAYAEVVRSPAYRDDKRGTTLQMLPELLRATGARRLPSGPAAPASRPRRPCWSATTRTRRATSPGWAGAPGWTPALLGVVAITVDSAAQAVGLVRRGARPRADHAHRRRGRRRRRRRRIPVGIDGETVMMPTPVRCTIQPRALRVVVPGNVLAFPPPSRPWNGRGCGTWPPSAPSRTANPSRPSRARSQARNHGRRRWPADLGTFPVRWSGEPFMHRPGSPRMPGLGGGATGAEVICAG